MVHKIDLIYLRTSTEMQNPQNQLKDCLSIAPEGAQVYEEKQSAWKDHINSRPVFNEICKLIKSGKVGSVTVWDMDRIYRKRLKTVEFMQMCRQLGVVVNSHRQPYFKAIENIPSPWNDIVRDQMIQILGWLAEEESNKKSERVRAAYQNHDGKKWGRPSNELLQHKNDVLMLRAEGLSIRKIAERLDLKKNLIEQTLKMWGGVSEKPPLEK